MQPRLGVPPDAYPVCGGWARQGYGHLMPGNEAEAAECIDAYLERANSDARLAALDD